MPGAAWANDQQLVVDRARIVVESFLNDPDFQQMRVYVQNAYGVLIIPDLLKGGFFVGVEHGTGVLLGPRPAVRRAGASPLSSTCGAAASASSSAARPPRRSSPLMNPGALQQMMTLALPDGRRRQRRGGRAGCRRRGRHHLQFGEDIYAFARNMGLYGGLAVDGTYVKPQDEWNQAFYGQPLTAEQIVSKRMAPEVLGTQALREALARF